jgi:cytochrome c553
MNPRSIHQYNPVHRLCAGIIGMGALVVACGIPVLAHASPSQAQPMRHVPDTMAQRTQPCTVCHGKEGRATNAGYFPRIAGKPATYLYNQLVNFRDGRRSYAAMTHLLDHLSDAYLREIADYFADLDLPYPQPQTVDTPEQRLERGRALVQHGDAKRELPACVRCHGSAMTGVAPATPGLLGLPRDYLVGQLGAWQNGRRHTPAPDCMAQVAQKLLAEDVGAIASWLAAQPLPSNTHAAMALPEKRPLNCGSLVQ